MPVRRVRITVRRMLVGVAVAGVLAGGMAWSVGIDRLGRHYIRVSNDHERRLDSHASTKARDPVRMREYEYTMMGKYRRLGFMPWLPVAPDPPEPE